MQSKVHKTDIRLLVAFQQALTKVVNRRELVVIIDFREVGLVEDRPAICGSGLVGVRIHQTGLPQPQEEIGIDLLHFLLEQALQQVKTPATANIAPALATRDSRGSGRFRAVEQAATPRRLLLEVKKPALPIGDRPTIRTGTHV